MFNVLLKFKIEQLFKRCRKYNKSYFDTPCPGGPIPGRPRSRKPTPQDNKNYDMTRI